MPESFTLKNDQTTEDPRVARVEEFDIRSLDYCVSEVLKPGQLEQPRSYTWRVGTTLDQGWTNGCVGFAWAHELAARPVEIQGITAEFAHDVIYWNAQKKDRYPGGSYPGADPISAGTSVLAGAKVIKELGFIYEYRWAMSLPELLAVLGYKGPVVFGCTWYKGMQETDNNGYVAPTGRQIGGHCVLLNGVRIIRTSSGTLDMARSWIHLHNSYGSDWGINGGARITLENLVPLLKNADMCVPLSRKRIQPDSLT